MRLIKPNIDLKSEYLEMLDEWKSAKEEMVPFSLRYDPNDFRKFIEINKKHETKPENDFVPHSTFWLVNESNKVIGTSNIRHELNAELLIENGHIGYGIRPSCRGKGFATKILSLSLEKAKGFGITKALLTCDKTNIASKKIIVKNGGVLRKEQIINGKEILSFWITIQKKEARS